MGVFKISIFDQCFLILSLAPCLFNPFLPALPHPQRSTHTAQILNNSNIIHKYASEPPIQPAAPSKPNLSKGFVEKRQRGPIYPECVCLKRDGDALDACFWLLEGRLEIGKGTRNGT